ncbi:sacsin N-terminal ATP-binding-like domain-containing protein [Williamsia sp. MIQD14]|uniref:sacsin N-terminal ATP-binding-like domain-containing protein n=1 Tax=Williamsia sp. MIQD14 TaxID=3425703 RepID=UPI003DA04C75
MTTVVVPEPDPFDTASIRSSTLRSWESSVTRLAEDVAAERELVEFGYRDRLLTELAANAADAADAAHDTGGGALAVWLEPSDVLHVANTGAPLHAEGVRSLSALRVSAKKAASVSDTGSAQVGRFGVGFNAVASVGVEVSVRSRTGGVVFGLRRTREALADSDIGVDIGGEIATAPLLRLPWPDPVAPADGYDTEVVVTLRDDVDGPTLLASMAGEISTLLLELPALESITCGDTMMRRTGSTTDDVDTLTIGDTTWTQVRTAHARWLMPGAADAPAPLDADVLHAPTRTDLALTLPAMCVADVAVTPDRRALHPDTDIRVAAHGYHRLALALDPAHRLAVLPSAGFPASATDGDLRDAVIADLTDHRWLPTADGELVAPGRAVVIADATERLTVLLAEFLDGVVIAELSDTTSLRRLAAVGVTETSLVDVCERLSGVTRPPQWWRDLYEAISPLIADDRVRGEIATIPVPRADGRMSIGARGLVLADLRARTDAADGAAPPSISWVATVHPDAEHPLLERLGAQRRSVGELLADPALRAAITDTHDSDSWGADADDPAEALAHEVLGLVAADPDADIPPWLGQLLIPTQTAEPDEEPLRPADELLLPDSPIASVLVADAPFGRVAAEVTDRHGVEALRRIGVGWGFTVIADELPTGPDHDLPDEAQWWDHLDSEPQRLVAVRDLDLVDPDRWAQALSLLATDPATAGTLTDPVGYTAWWLRTYAEIDDTPLGWFRAPDDDTFTGVLDPLDHPHAALLAGALAGAEVTSTDLAAVVLRRLGDADRDIAPGVAATAHAALVRAHRRGVLDLDRLDPPVGVRTLAGTVSDTAVVIDAPWMLQIVDPDDAVVLPPPLVAADATRLASILDIATAGEDLAVTVAEPGEPSTWAQSAVAWAFALTTGIAAPGGEVRLHDAVRLDVRHGDGIRHVEVDWWVDDAGVHHLGQIGDTTRRRR